MAQPCGFANNNAVLAALLVAVSVSYASVSIAIYCAHMPLQSNTVVITEFLDNKFPGGLFSEPPYTINAIGHWDAGGPHQSLAVKVAPSDVTDFEEIKSLVKNLLTGNKKFTNDSRIDQHEFEKWNDLLSNTVNGTKVPKLYFKTSGSSYDILIKLTDKSHPNGKTTAETKLYLEGKTIKSSEIIIYEVNRVYSDGEFIAVLQHELGHAIGVGHSNYFGSIMYPSLVIINGELVGTISECEVEGVKLAYSAIDDTAECMKSLATK
jgi:hypothetical protein